MRSITSHSKVKAWLAGAGAVVANSAHRYGPQIELWFRKLHTGRVVHVPRAELLMLLATCNINPVPVLVTPAFLKGGRGVLAVLAELYYIVPSPQAFDQLIVACRSPEDYALLFDTERLARMDPLLPADLREFMDIFDHEFTVAEMLSWLSDRVHQNRCEMPSDPLFAAKQSEGYPLLAKGYE